MRGRVEKFSLEASLDLLSIHCSRSPERQVRPIIHRVLVVGGQVGDMARVYGAFSHGS
jgi:hypothetical protein